MIRLDKTEFEKRGGVGCKESDYELQRTTCCQKPVVWDDELDDIYFDPDDLTKTVRVWEQGTKPCPLCGTSEWQLTEWEETGTLPTEWLWAIRK